MPPGDLSIHRSPLQMKRRKAGFTLVELLVATVVLLAIMAIIFSVTQEASNAWKNTTGKIEGFRSARSAFDAMTRAISQATLNTYYDYANVSGGKLNFLPLSSSSTPTTYARNSDLQIITAVSGISTTSSGAIAFPTSLCSSPKVTAVTHAIFFQAPMGVVGSANASPTASGQLGSLNSLLNICGFYVAYGPDPTTPTFLSTAKRYRYRLMQFTQPSELMSVYGTVASGGARTSAKGTSTWYLPGIQTDAASTSPTSDFVLGENIIALIILPKLAVKDETAVEQNPQYSINVSNTPLGTALSPAYAYDSSTTGQGGTLNPNGTSYLPLLNSMNQLPPVFQVTMVALDEASALKMGNTTVAPSAVLGLSSTLFTQARNLQTDLTSLQNTLTAAHLNYRVFQTEVAIPGAKWTAQ